MPMSSKGASYERLSAIDAGFWLNESCECPLHIGYVGLGQGTTLEYESLVAHVRDRLHLLPRHRQRIRTTNFGLARPVWVDDANFDISHHVRHRRIEEGHRDPLECVSEIIAQPLDLARSPWELWLLDGFDDGTVVVVVKYHHCMMDAVGMVNLAHALFDDSPGGSPVHAPPWAPAAEPSEAELIAWSLRDAARAVRGLGWWGAARSGRNLLQVLRRVRSQESSPAPKTALEQPIGPRRRLVSLDVPITDVRAIQHRTGATINDVVLSVAMHAVGRLLRRMGKAGPDELQVHVPISLRDPAEGQSPAPGNRITLVAARLPLGDAEDTPDLARTMEIMNRHKATDGGRLVAAMDRASNALPVPLLARISRRHFSSDGYNLIVSNIPGPPTTYLMGIRAQQVVPVGFLTPGHALTMAVISYEDKLTFGLLADPDAIDDLTQLARDVEASFEALKSASLGRTGSRTETAGPGETEQAQGTRR